MAQIFVILLFDATLVDAQTERPPRYAGVY